MPISSSGRRRTTWRKPSPAQRISWIEKDRYFKRGGTAAGMRFAKYHGSATVGEYIERGGTWGDLKYDIDHRLLGLLKSTQTPEATSVPDKALNIPAQAGGIYVVTLNNEELISTQAHDRRFDDKPVLKVNRNNRKFGKADSFTGRELQGYVRTFTRPNVNFYPVIAVGDTERAERAVASALRPWCLRSPNNRLTEWTAGIETDEMVDKIVYAVESTGLQFLMLWKP